VHKIPAATRTKLKYYQSHRHTYILNINTSVSLLFYFAG
jgi:hypothetical protein